MRFGSFVGATKVAYNPINPSSRRTGRDNLVDVQTVTVGTGMHGTLRIMLVGILHSAP
jgi:hypothetical protein